MSRTLVAAIVAVLCLGLGPGARAFTFEKVIDNTSELVDSFGIPHLNDVGQVVFHGTKDGVAGLYVAAVDQDPQLVVDQSHPLFDSFDPFAFINNSSTVVGWARGEDEEDQYVFTASAGGSVDIIAETNATYDNLATAPSINDDGLVAFASDTRTRIHTRAYPDPAATMVDTTGDFNTFWLPLINNQQAISFAGFDNEKGAVYRLDDAGLTMIMDNQGEFTGVLPYSTPNSAGEVAIHARRPSTAPSRWAILRGDGDSLQTLVEAADHGFADSAFDLEINDNGLVAFGPRMASDSSLALYFHDGDDLRKVLQRGDPLFGDTVRDVFFARGLNQNDQVAFMYLLDNDEFGIATTTLVDPGILVGDMNFDGVVDTGDVAPFVLALTDPKAYLSQQGVDQATMVAAGDVNGDGVFDTGDVAPFVQLLVGAGASVPEPGTLVLLGAAALALLRRGGGRRSGA